MALAVTPAGRETLTGVVCAYVVVPLPSSPSAPRPQDSSPDGAGLAAPTGPEATSAAVPLPTNAPTNANPANPRPARCQIPLMMPPFTSLPMMPPFALLGGDEVR